MTFLILVVACLLVLLAVRIILQIVTRLTLGRCTCNTYLAGKTALITGGNSGLGYETALALAGRGCRVIIADRDNCDETKANIIKITGNTNIITKYFDLASLKSVRSLAKDINETEKRLDILINNAGTTGLGNRYTEDGLHVGMQVNHFGSFLLTHLLIGILKKSAPSRIIFVSSLFAYYNNLTPKNLNYDKDVPANMWSEFRIYCNSKLCNLITASELSKKLSGTGITAYSLHPGLVSTAIFSKLRNGLSHAGIYYWLFEKLVLQPFAKSAEEGAQTTIHLALAKEVEKFSGKYFSDCKVFVAPPKSADPLFVENIWKLSEEFAKLTPEELL